MSTSERFKHVRNRLNCNQEELAMALGVTRALISHAEKRRRNLPSDADFLLFQLYDLLKDDPDPVLPEAHAATTDLNNLKFEWEQQLKLQTRKLADMQERLRQSISSLNACSKIRTAFPQQENLEYMLRRVEASARSTQESVTPAAIALQELKIKALQAGWEALNA